VKVAAAVVMELLGKGLLGRWRFGRSIAP